MQAFGADRLNHEIKGARTHGGDDIVDTAVCGLHDDRHPDPCLAHARQNAKPVKLGHHQVEDDAIDARALRPLQQREPGIAIVAA